ncbi:MAG: hypothetical protein ACMXX9_03070 [Candidatus Woesearchaeota archaeon]
MVSKECVVCEEVFFKKDIVVLKWGLEQEISDHHFNLKKYCSDKCKDKAKRKRNPRSSYHKEWGENNKDKISTYISKQKENRNKASKKYYYKNK